MRFLHWLLRTFMRKTEERMIRRLLRQRDAARAEIDTYRQHAEMKSGEFLR